MSGYNSKNHVVDLSVGSVLGLLLCFALLGGCLLAAAYVLQQPDTPAAPSVRQPSGQIGSSVIKGNVDPSSKEAAELYGPLNVDALTETKRGPLVNWIRSRRSGGCQPCQTQSRVVCVPQASQGYWAQPQPCYPSAVVSPRPALSPCDSGRCPVVQPRPQAETPVTPLTPSKPSLPRLPDLIPMPRTAITDEPPVEMLHPSLYAYPSPDLQRCLNCPRR